MAAWNESPAGALRPLESVRATEPSHMNKFRQNNKIRSFESRLARNLARLRKNFLFFPPRPGLAFGAQVLWAGRPAMELTRHVNVVAACAAFAFLGAILFGAF